MKQRNNNNKVRKPRTNGLRRSLIPHPPQLDGYQITHSVKVRFIVKTALDNTTGVVSAANLLATWLVSSSTLAVWNLFDTVKVKSIEMWSLPVIGSTATVQATFNGPVGPTQGDETVHTDTSMGLEPAHLLVRPNARSLAANFQDPTSGNLFVLNAPVGTVIDLHCVFKQTWLTAPVAATNGLSLVAGDIYLRGLDGLALASTSYTVVGGTQA